MPKKYRYFVEGECEKKLLRSFMFLDNGGFIDGKVEVLNFVNKPITKSLAYSLKSDTTIVIVIDTDVDNIDILRNNLKIIAENSNVSADKILLVFSVKTLEDEIVYACASKIKSVNDIFKTKTIEEFKKKFINHHELKNKLESIGFDIQRIWSRKPKKPFDKYVNSGGKIKR